MEYELHGGQLLPPVQTLAATIIFLSDQERKMQIESLSVPIRESSGLFSVSHEIFVEILQKL